MKYQKQKSMLAAKKIDVSSCNTLPPLASLTIASTRLSFFQYLSTRSFLWRVTPRFTDGTACFATWFAKKKNPKPNNKCKKHPKETKKKDFYLEEAFLTLKKKSTSRTQQKDCWLSHSAGMLYKILYIPIWNKKSQQFLILHLYFTNTSVERSCKFCSQFFNVLRSLYSIFNENFRTRIPFNQHRWS